MGEEAFDETVLSSNRGTVILRGGYGREEVWLGVTEDNDPESQPDVIVPLTPRQQKALVEEIGRITIVTVQEMKDKVKDLTDKLDVARGALETLIESESVVSAGNKGAWYFVKDTVESAIDVIGDGLDECV